MEITERGPVQKAHWSHVAARLDIFEGVISEFGVNEELWEWRYVYHNFLGHCLNHNNPDVRLLVTEIIVQLYRIVGPALKAEVAAGPTLKPAL